MTSLISLRGDSHQLERELIAKYEYLYGQLILTSSTAAMSVEKLEKEVKLYNASIRQYDLDIRRRNEKRLVELGGLKRLLAADTPTSSNVINMSQTVVGSCQQGLDRKGIPKVLFAKRIETLVSAAEADELRYFCDNIGFRPFVRNISGTVNGLSKREPARTHTACTLHSPEMAAWLWPRVEPLVSEYTTTFNSRQWHPFAINPCFRFSCYSEGQLFETHTDDVFQKFDWHPPVRSFLTVVIYLNEDFESGFIRYVSNRLSGATDDTRVLASVAPETGLGMIFQHDLLHEALPPRGPVPKYIVRTDVLCH